MPQWASWRRRVGPVERDVDALQILQAAQVEVATSRRPRSPRRRLRRAGRAAAHRRSAAPPADGRAARRRPAATPPAGSARPRPAARARRVSTRRLLPLRLVGGGIGAGVAADAVRSAPGERHRCPGGARAADRRRSRARAARSEPDRRTLPSRSAQRSPRRAGALRRPGQVGAAGTGFDARCVTPCRPASPTLRCRRGRRAVAGAARRRAGRSRKHQPGASLERDRRRVFQVVCEQRQPRRERDELRRRRRRCAVRRRTEIVRTPRRVRTSIVSARCGIVGRVRTTSAATGIPRRRTCESRDARS